MFGFRDDGIPRQYNYLIDESQTMKADGKGIHGPDAVISMVDHALTNYSHGERTVYLHADNCGGLCLHITILNDFHHYFTLISLMREYVLNGQKLY